MEQDGLHVGSTPELDQSAGGSELTQKHFMQLTGKQLTEQKLI